MKMIILVLGLFSFMEISAAQESSYSYTENVIAPQQGQWKVGQYYASRGQVWTEWQTRYMGNDFYGNPIYQRYCRKTKWHSEYRSGYYYVWNGFQYISQWYEGTQWYCTWSAWYTC